MRRYKIKEFTYLDGSKRTLFYVKFFLFWERIDDISTMEEFEEYLKRRRNSIVIDTKTTHLQGV